MSAMQRPLLDLLGARWRVGMPASAVAWDSDGAFAGFALGDGSLALVPAAWDGAPGVRPRDGGGTEIVPATAEAPPTARLRVHQGACLSVVRDPDAGFLTAGADGQIVRVLTDGEIRVVASLNGRSGPIAAGRGGWRAYANGRAVHRLGGAAASIDVAGEVTSLSVDPEGARLAIGYDGGVALWAGGDAPRIMPAPGAHAGMAWCEDGSWLASYTAGSALQAWRLPELGLATAEGPVRCLAALGDAFAVGIGGRILLWRPAEERMEPCGVANQAPVTCIASRPQRALIAAGYGNGAVVLCRPNSSELLFIRAAGEGAVSALAWSQAGDRLAIGTEGGEIAVVALPDMLFRENARAQ